MADPPSVQRKLAAILAADVAGYSRLMGADEEGTLARLKALRAEVIDPKIAAHNGRIVKTTGDGLLVEFASVVDAMRCATQWQAAMAGRGGDIAFRIGVNLGDIIIDGDDIFGDGVNIAARLEAVAEPGGICISRTVLAETRGKLDFSVEDLGGQALKNIAQPVHVFRVLAGGKTMPESAALALPDKPSIAVLPFQNMSGDPEQEYFADGMVEEITTAIARLPWLFVIARNSAFTYKGKAVDVKQVARELGVRYVLEGSVRKGGNRVRITGQLIDTATGAHIWADRFDGALDDVFELQDQIASNVAGAIEPRLRQSEIERASRKPSEGLGPYDLYLRALAEMHKPDVSAFAAAIPLLRQALAIDPSYVPAASLFAGARQRQHTSGVKLSAEEIGEAVHLARRAIETASADPEALARSASVLAWLGGEHAIALSALERATAINPNSAFAWSVSGVVNCFACRPDAAIASVQRAMRLSPLDPGGYQFKAVLAYALMIAGRYEEAMEWIDRSLSDRPREHFPMRAKVAISGYLGRADASEWAARLLALNPAMTIAGFREIGKFLSAGTMAVWIEGFRRAGLPEA